MNTNLFLKLFGHPGISRAKIPGYPATKFGFPGFRRTYRTFWPPPLHVEDPHPTRKYPDQKVWVWVPFSSLRNCPWNRQIYGTFRGVFRTFRFAFRFTFLGNPKPGCFKPGCLHFLRVARFEASKAERNKPLAHQNRTIAIASDLRCDGAKSPEFLQKEPVLGSEIAARNRKSLAMFHRTLKSQCRSAWSSLGNR